MSVKPFFLTGGNAKIKINGKVFAFCTDIAYSIDIQHQTPKILGMYEGSSVEPLGYTVSGSFTIIRYAKDADAALGGGKPPGIAGNDAGNGVGNWGSTWGSGIGGGLKGALGNLGVGNDGRGQEALDPSRFANGTTFDIEIYQKVPIRKTGHGPQTHGSRFDTSSGLASLPGIKDLLSGVNSVRQAADNINNKIAAITNPTTVTDSVGVAKIRNARITKADFSLSKKGIATQRFSFVALYVDEDSFVADFSGQGQHF